MNHARRVKRVTRIARGLGWFSVGLGLAEVLAGRRLGQSLGIGDQATLIRGFGLREIATGVAILALERPEVGLLARVAGDGLDLGVLGAGYTADNPQKVNLTLAITAVAGITALDYWCARQLSDRESARKTA